jgi:aminopeptidase
MSTTTAPSGVAFARQFPAFDLQRLLTTVFTPNGGERVCILIDLDDPKEVKDFGFLQNPDLSIQRHAHDTFYQGLRNGVMKAMNLTGGEMFAYELTGGSNLDLPEKGYATDGREIDLIEDVYKKYDIILCISTYSATAPLTAFAKKFGFRGATLHGVNQIILSSGLAVDYNEVSVEAEKLRLGMTNADWVEIDYILDDKSYTLHLQLDGQDAQKSHGLCRGGPDVANLPAGEIYYVPTDATGQFPLKYEDGTIGIMEVKDCRVYKATLVRGSQATIDEHNHKLATDPVTGELGELGFGTQVLPVSGRDIQDEKIRGTMHVATGRSDHLGGRLTPDMFASKKNATHDDILFSPSKTPEINVPQVRMHRKGETVVLIENFVPAAYLQSLLA